MALDPPSPPSWVIDLNDPPPTRPKNAQGIPDPPGFPSSSSAVSKKQASKAAATPRKPPTKEEMDTLKLKKAWEIAMAPAKQLPMNAIMMWMSGNSLQIFSIMMVFMLFKNPINSLLQMNASFGRFETEGTKEKMIPVKLTYIGMNLLALGLGIWKINTMGLLPNTRSDWLAWETQREPLERTIFAL